MLMIRLQRVGKKNQAMFRVLLTDKHNGPKSGRFKAMLGSYNPHTNEVVLKKEEIQEWIAKGAQPSDTMHNLLVREGVIKGKKRNVLPKRTPIVKEAPEGEAEAAPTEEASAPEEAVSEEKTEEAVVETPAPEEKPAEEKKDEAAPEEKKEEPKEEVAEEAKDDSPKEEPKEDEAKKEA